MKIGDFADPRRGPPAEDYHLRTNGVARMSHPSRGNVTALRSLDPSQVGQGEDPHVVEGSGIVYALPAVHVYILLGF